MTLVVTAFFAATAVICLGLFLLLSVDMWVTERRAHRRDAEVRTNGSANGHERGGRVAEAIGRMETGG